MATFAGIRSFVGSNPIPYACPSHLQAEIMAMRKVAALAALRRLAASQSRALSTLSRSAITSEPVEAGVLDAAKAGSSVVQTRSFAAEPAKAPAASASKGYVKSVSLKEFGQEAIVALLRVHDRSCVILGGFMVSYKALKLPSSNPALRS